MSKLEEEMASLTQLADGLTGGIAGFFNGWKHREAKFLEREAQHKAKAEDFQRLEEEWNRKIAAKREEHRQIEQSIGSLKAQMAELLRKLDVGPRAA